MHNWLLLFRTHVNVFRLTCIEGEVRYLIIGFGSGFGVCISSCAWFYALAGSGCTTICHFISLIKLSALFKPASGPLCKWLEFDEND